MHNALMRLAGPALLLLTLLTLFALAQAHPGLRFVDFISFAERAQRLWEGQDLLNGRYPVGYPALLALLSPPLGALVAGKALSVAGAVLAVFAVHRWLGPFAALWLLVQPAFLAWGSTEGTDMLALSLALLALSLVERGPAWAVGALAGAAAMMRYPAAAVLPVLLLGLAIAPGPRARRLGECLGAFLLLSSPHWAGALLGLGPLLPEAGENTAIGMGDGPPAPALERWFQGLRVAGAGLLWSGTPPEPPQLSWPVVLGLAGLSLGLLRRDLRALLLLLLAAAHLAVLGFFFSNERLALPLSVPLLLGVAFLPRALPLLAAVGLSLLSLPRAFQVDPAAQAREEIVAAASQLGEPVASSSPWFYLHRQDGFIESGTLLREAVPAGATPGQLSPTMLRAWAQGSGVRYVALDLGRVHRTFPGLRPLLRGSTDGFREVAAAPGWRLLEILP